METWGGNRVRALNEPSHIACGAPDFIVERNGVPTGHVECKDVNVNLDDVENDEQLRRYRPAEKWLKNRKGRILSFHDITHYRTLCAALAETPGVMTSVDATIAIHSGWPLTC